MTSLASDIQNYQCFINGQWAGAENGETIEVEDPANGQVLRPFRHVRPPRCRSLFLFAQLPLRIYC